MGLSRSVGTVRTTQPYYDERAPSSSDDTSTPFLSVLTRPPYAASVSPFGQPAGRPDTERHGISVTGSDFGITQTAIHAGDPGNQNTIKVAAIGSQQICRRLVQDLASYGPTCHGTVGQRSEKLVPDRCSVILASSLQRAMKRQEEIPAKEISFIMERRTQ